MLQEQQAEKNKWIKSTNDANLCQLIPLPSDMLLAQMSVNADSR